MSKTVKYDNMKLLAQFRKKLCSQPKLVFLFFELTDSCNMSCIHCGSSSSPHNRTFLKFEGIKSVLDSVAKKYSPGEIMVCLTGGEPLLHPDFYNIAKYATDAGFLCGITTNGTLIDETAAQKIKESGIRSMAISLDGIEETHDWFRGKKGSYKKTIEGIDSLKSIYSDNIAIQVTTVVHKGNLNQLDALYDILSTKTIDSWRIINMDPIGRAEEHTDLLLDKEEYEYLLRYIREKRFSNDVELHVTYGCSHYLGLEFEMEVRDDYFLCGSGIIVGSVLSNGDICGCLDIERRPELIQGNIFNDDFVEVWENKFKEYRGDRAKACEDCINCSEAEYCRGDSMHTWDFDNQRPKMCYNKTVKKEM